MDAPRAACEGARVVARIANSGAGRPSKRRGRRERYSAVGVVGRWGLPVAGRLRASLIPVALLLPGLGRRHSGGARRAEVKPANGPA